MSNEFNNSNNGNNAEERVYKINVKSSENFCPTSAGKYIDSTEFCRKVNNILKAAYSDCVGTTFEPVPGTNTFMICAYFDHLNHGSDVTAVTKKQEDENTRNSTLRMTRAYNRRLQEGDKYHMTPEGKDGLKDFILNPGEARGIYQQGKNGLQVNWGKICTDLADSSYGVAPQQYTKISFFDCAKLAAVIYGEEDEDGNPVEYGVRILRSLPTYNGVNGGTGYMLEVDRVSRNAVIELCNKFGIGYQPGLNIIR